MQDVAEVRPVEVHARGQLNGLAQYFLGFVVAAEVVVHHAEIRVGVSLRLDIDRLLEGRHGGGEIAGHHVCAADVIQTAHVLRVERDDLAKLPCRLQVAALPEIEDAECVVDFPVPGLQPDRLGQDVLGILRTVLRQVNLAQAGHRLDIVLVDAQGLEEGLLGRIEFCGLDVKPAQRHVHHVEIRIQVERRAAGVLGGADELGLGRFAELPGERAAAARISGSVFRIDLERGVEPVEGLRRAFRGARLVELVRAAAVQQVGVELGRIHRVGERAPLVLRQRDAQRGNRQLRDLVADGEKIGRRPVERTGQDMKTRSRVDQLHDDANRIALDFDAALEIHRDPQALADPRRGRVRLQRRRVAAR